MYATFNKYFKNYNYGTMASIAGKLAGAIRIDSCGDTILLPSPNKMHKFKRFVKYYICGYGTITFAVIKTERYLT